MHHNIFRRAGRRTCTLHASVFPAVLVGSRCDPSCLAPGTCLGLVMQQGCCECFRAQWFHTGPYTQLRQVCFAVPCFAVPCCAMPCRAMMGCVLLCCAMLWSSMLCYAVPCCAVLCHAVLCCAVLC
jgi:hypothetical protein